MDRVDVRRRLERRVCADLGAEAVTRLCPRCASTAHGRPSLVMAGAPYLSLSYADGLGLAAWTPDGPIGVDVALDGPPVGEYGDRRAWTRAEAVLKATGDGLRHDPRDGLPEAWTAALEAPPGHVATVAVLGLPPGATPAVTVSWLTP